MSKRSAEFVLDLDIMHRAIKRQELLLQEIELKERWAKAIQKMKVDLAKSPVVVRALPEQPTAIWPPAPLAPASSGLFSRSAGRTTKALLRDANPNGKDGVPAEAAGLPPENGKE